MAYGKNGSKCWLAGAVRTFANHNDSSSGPSPPRDAACSARLRCHPPFKWPCNSSSMRAGVRASRTEKVREPNHFAGTKARQPRGVQWTRQTKRFEIRSSGAALASQEHARAG